MRIALVVSLFLAAGVVAQEPVGGSCRVVTGTPDIGVTGEFSRPRVTPEDCAAAEAIVEKLLEMERRDFRLTVSPETVPGNVRVFVGRIAPGDRFWRPGSVTEAESPGQRHVVTWLSDKLAIVVYETSEFAGDVLTVIIADLEALQACTYARWPVARGDPRELSVTAIQEVLEDVRSGRRSTPVCRLEPLVID